jgi:NAD(P)-dependent dehydrogenase (short-subunit alcohol dehydrogenase family)
MTGFGRTAVVTGASSGIGHAVALDLAAAGYDVVVAGRSNDRLDAVVDAIRARERRVAKVAADLADPATPGLVAAAAAELGEQLDVLVNSAAVIKTGPFESAALEDFDTHFGVNVRAPYFLTQTCLPMLRRAPSASVVNISSASSHLVRREQSLYGTTKAALEHLTRILAAELAPDGIRVNVIAPGPVDTPIHATWADDVEQAKEWLVEQVPLGRIGTVADISAWVTWLVSDQAAWTTGAVIRVDGGQALDPR